MQRQTLCWHSAVSQRLTCETFYTYIIEDLFAYDNINDLYTETETDVNGISRLDA